MPSSRAWRWCVLVCYLQCLVFTSTASTSEELLPLAPNSCNSPDQYRCKDDKSQGQTLPKDTALGIFSKHECIPRLWLCDNDKDCPLGDDEEQNCTNPVCSSDQFQCLPTSQVRCIAKGWQCDGEEDCDNGEDEVGEICRTKTKKGTRRGNLVDTFKCLPNQYRCPKTRSCIHITQICDNVVHCPLDGADEGPHCINRACAFSSCAHAYCKESVQGPVCFCDDGQAWNETTSTCDDVDECKYDSFCDQGCVNKPSGFTCSCSHGYVLEDTGSCRIPKDTKAKLALANFINLELLDLDQTASAAGGDKGDKYVIEGHRIMAMDIDVRNNSLCWITYMPVQESSKLMCADASDSTRVWQVNVEYPLDSVTAIAKDWISGNWYFADKTREVIFLCTQNGEHCRSILSIGIRRPRSMVIDATKGLLFYSDWFASPHLGRIDLDGQNAKVLASIKLVHPNGLTLDLANEHVYWGDSFLNVIERFDYNGENRMVIAKGSDVYQLFGMTILENFLYVANHQNNTILRIHRYNNTVPDQIIMRASHKPGSIKIFHPVAQPFQDVDVCQLSQCDHFCIPVPDHSNSTFAIKAKCVCRFGFAKVAGTQCQARTTEKFILLANGQQGMIHFVSPSDGSVDLYPPITNLGRPVAVAYDSTEGYVYYSDLSKPSVGRRKFNSRHGPEEIITKGINCDDLEVDWIGRNLYCADSSRNKIWIISLRNTSLIATLMSSDTVNEIIYPKALAIDTDNSILYWTDWVLSEGIGNASINNVALDGSSWNRIEHANIQWSNGLTLDRTRQILYWTDAFYDKIESVQTNGSQRQVVYKFDKNRHPYGLALVGMRIVWAESRHGKLSQFNLETQKFSVHRNNSAPIFGVKYYSKEMQVVSDHPCTVNNGGCSDFCLLGPDTTAVCKCADGRSTTDDGVTCTGEVTRTGCQMYKEFQCDNGQCIPLTKKCNRLFDCLDKSDENNCLNVTCPHENMYQCNTSRCIYMQFVCDGEMDCANGDDEVDCHARVCADDHFLCGKSGQCIPQAWKCDGVKDCTDESDEKSEDCCPAGSCEANTSCGPDTFTCNDGRCIKYQFKCDNEYDCADHSDEHDCNNWCNPAREFKCHNGSKCLALYFKCDGNKDCKDGSDEKDCAAKPAMCHDTEFSCNDGTCLHNEFKCDFNKDCPDGSDEIDCPANKTCHWREFKCDNEPKCIPSNWQCDGDDDCADKSDEKHCAKLCPMPNFACHKHQTMCLHPSKLCDNVNDCPDHSDEGRLCEYDMCLNNDCEFSCHTHPLNGFVCSCPEHMRLRPDNRTCVDIDVCETWGICSQLCGTTAQGYRCLCHEGYTLKADGYSCKPDDPEPVEIIYSSRHEIRRLNLKNNSLVSLVVGLSNTIALDFHYKKSLLFWTDFIEDEIYRGEITANTVSKIVPIVKLGLVKTEGIAVDWVTDTIYWAESNIDQIEVAKLDGSNRGTLVTGNMTSPRAIALDPRIGKMFWTDWDENMPRIETCSMACEPHTRKILYDMRVHKGSGWLNGLALDFEAMRIYWVDALSDSIHTITYEGTDHHLVLKAHHYLNHPFSLTVFEHHIYWTEWKLNNLVKANKFNGSDVSIVQRIYSQPFDLHIFHPKRQPYVKNPCENSKCSHLCLIGEGMQPVCKCPYRYKISNDEITCIEDRTFLLFVKKNEIRGVDLENCYHNVIPSITVPLVENASSIDYDVQHERLYWADTKRNVITSALLDGTGITTVIDSDLSNPSAFAIDWISRNMYFSSYNADQATISVAQLDGAYRNEIYKSSTARPSSIAVHPSRGLMFWSDIGGKNHAIWTAKMDGKEPTILASGDQVKKASSLTVDLDGNRLYWISLDLGLVFWCDIDTVPCQPQKETDFVVKSPISMAMYKDPEDSTSQLILFYANKTGIIRYKDGKHKVVRKDTPNVFALQVYDPKRREGKTNGCAVNNGDCEQLCLPSGESSVCNCTVGFVLDGLKKCKGIESFLLYSQSSEINGITINQDSKPTKALAPISKISQATSVDFHDEHIYWVDSNRRQISRIKRDLSGRQTIVSDGISGAESLAVDWISGNIYWTDLGHKVIEMSRLNGSSRYIIVHDDIEKPRSLVVHPTKGYLFFADWATQPKIVRTRLDGSERVNFVVATEEHPMKAPSGIAIDYQTDDLYWCDKDLNIIERVSVTGERTTILNHDLIDCLSLAVYKDRIYWADGTDLGGSIKSIDKLKPGSITVIKKNIANLRDINIFDLDVQKGSNQCSQNNGGCQDLCFYLGNSRVKCACSHGKLMEDGKSCGEFEAFLLYSEITSLKSLRLFNTTNLNPPRKTIQDTSHMHNVIGLAFDYEKEKIFFTDIQQGNIQSVYFNGTDFRVVLHAVGSAEGLAFEPIGRHLYWTSYSGSNINRITFDPKTGNASTEVVKQLRLYDHPRDIVVNICIKRIFWSNWSDRQPSIQAISFMNEEHLVSGNAEIENIISSGIHTPNGMTIDHKAQRLYWADASLNKIERCNMDGSNRVVLVSTLPQHSFGLAVYGDFLYWTDWALRAVIRVNKYTGGDLIWLKKNINRQPMDIIAVAKDSEDCRVNPCHNNAFGCSDICLNNDKGQPECQCEPGLKLMPDGKRCIVESLENCQMTDFICEDHRLCVSFDKTCDGISDCLDASDESLSYCNVRQCSPSFFKCERSSRCIPFANQCDGREDCLDGSDERQCPCADNQFQCTNGMCILAKYRCDFDSDCTDNSDEINCGESKCDERILSGKMDLVPCNTTSMCISPSWICDGSNDCLDSNDEANCGTTGVEDCPDHAFKCQNGNCILPQWKCDKQADCADGSDELDCNFTCKGDQHSCSDSMCLPHTWVCDGHPDCRDGSDEADQCEKKNCTAGFFRCSSGRCIPREWLCDGDQDCPKGEDERVDSDANCPAVKCEADQMLCLNRRCIRAEYRCDGENDCIDMSDEPDTCVYDQCKDHEFQCQKEFKCIKASKRCDKRFDCPDHTDEENCPSPTDVIPFPNLCQNSTFFKCDNGACIDYKLVCDGKQDCSDSSDEPSKCNVNECKSHKPVCSQKCVDIKLGYECKCFPGYRREDESVNSDVSSPNRKCVDVDECITSHPCSHFCFNTIGSFKCSCAHGYRLLPDQRSCWVVSVIQSQLLISSRGSLQLINIKRKNNITTVTKDPKNAVAVDYDWKEQYIFWTDISGDKSSISRMSYDFISGKKGEPEQLHSITVRNPDGLAVDWVGRNLYWCDKTTDTIEVSRLDGKYRKVLLRDGLQEPRALEVFPQKGFLFFSDWGTNAHISRINMDGTGLKVIINESITWPNALTIDYVTERIFWGDGNLDYIGMADLNGDNVQIVIGDNTHVPHVFALTTFESFLFWSDWDRRGVFSANKFSGSNVTNHLQLVDRPMDIQVVHPLRQLPVIDKYNRSPCDLKRCSHLCLLRPSEDGKTISPVCACPENHILGKDGRSCISNCTSSQFLCETGSKCIPFWWRCDGVNDCADGSDEPEGECSTYHCTHQGMFQCLNATSSKGCILPIQICDGSPQCADKSDERICSTYTCMDHFVKCQKDNKCIPKRMKCDGDAQCSDGEDEKDCEKPECKKNEFKCANGNCIPHVWRCDVADDCGDGSDETPDCKDTVCPDSFRCNNTGRCIPNSWKCDGGYDCGENDWSDENSEDCSRRTCKPGDFKCLNGHCISQRWVCDYNADCLDGSDELGCFKEKCDEGEFRCNNSQCIPGKLKCDGNFDCTDKSDEECEANCDTESQFQCRKYPHCVSKKFRCDGDADCFDGTDEMECDFNCTKDEFSCKNALCIPNQWRCDGEDDCGDKSDELNCTNIPCPVGRFRCFDHTCIWNSLVCNHYEDCPNGDDEEEDMCKFVKNCKAPNFLCESHKQCLQPSQLCNNVPDCDDRSDENTDVCNQLNTTRSESCHPFNGGCDHYCNDMPHGPQCSCKKFFVLNSNGMTCALDNPCLHYGTCSQRCSFDENLLVYNCSCAKGYEAIEGSCKAIGQSPEIVIAEKGNIMVLTHVHKTESPKLTPVDVEELTSHIRSVDVDIGARTAFFINLTDTDYQLMKQTNMPISQTSRRKRSANNPAEKLHLKDRQLFAMHGLAVDWVTQRIYLTDATNRAIHVYNYDGQRGKTVVKGNIGDPYAVAVDPIAGRIFWTDRNPNPKIESANLDGSNRIIIVSTEMGWPNGISLDTNNGWVYWADTKKRTVEVARYDGSGRKILYTTIFAQDPPLSLEVFEDSIYVLTHGQSALLKLHRFNTTGEKNVAVIFNTVTQAKDISVVQESKQLKVQSNCTHSCKETQICFNRPQHPDGFICLCPDGATFKDGKCDFAKHEDCNSHCLNGGTCDMAPVSGRPKCSCPPAFAGDTCEIQVCENFCFNGKCTPPKITGGKPKCECAEGYSGEKCEKFVCADYCLNNGICSLGPDKKPVCICSKYFSGPQCGHERQFDDWCPDVCFNNATCKPESQRGYVTCECKKGFTGKRCDQCKDLTCHNNGKCRKDSHGQSTCECPPHLNPDVGCLHLLPCKKLCENKAATVFLADKSCDCKCAPHFEKSECCLDHCEHGTCVLVKGKPQCKCDEYHEGDRCEVCKCETTGTCIKDKTGQPTCNCSMETFGKFCEDNCFNSCGKHGLCTECFLNVTSRMGECKEDKCVCKKGYTGTLCKTSLGAAKAGAGSGSTTTIILVIVCILIVLVILAAIIVFKLYKRRRSRLAQYGHKRMDKGANMNVSNPVFMKKDEDDDDDEAEPLSGGRVIFTGDDASNNFANPMYDVLHNDSRQKLMNSNVHEENHNFDPLDVQYLGTENGGEHLKADSSQA